MIVTHSGTDVQASISNRENYRKEKEREKGNIPEKRKEGASQASGTPLGFYKKKACTFGNFQGSESSANTRFKGEANPAKRLLDRDGNERKYFCRRCKRNHPGKDCDGNLVECNFCHKRGHREYEYYTKKGSGSQQPGGQHRQQNSNNSGRQVNLQYGNGNHGNQGHTLYLCHISQEGKMKEDPKDISYRRSEGISGCFY